MEVQTFYPEHPLLEKYIEYYYFLKTDDPDFRTAYYAFPNTLQAFNLHRAATCDIGENTVTVRAQADAPPLVILQGRYEWPMLARLEGRLDKVTINFKPLGLNPFINGALGEIAPAFSQVFTQWPEVAWVDAFFQTSDLRERVGILEEFLLARFREPEDTPLMKAALEALTDFDGRPGIDDIARELAMTPRSFQRLFYKHMGVSPAAFRKIARFRHSMGNKLFSYTFKTLTEIGYNSNFYDQSYFIKMYRKLTGDNPSNFFNSVDKLADDNLILKFIHE
jgi:AraC-like DNA-binding protein